MFGWASAGPVRLAAARTPVERGELLAESVSGRALIALPLTLVGAIWSAWITSDPSTQAIAAAMCVATGASGLSNAWFAVGLGRPKILALFEVFPRLLGVAAGIGALAITGSFVSYAMCVLLSTVASVVALIRHARAKPFSVPAECVYRGLKAQLPLVGASLVSSFYTASPVLIVAAVHAPDAAELVSADKLYRFSLFAIIALGNSLQSWVLEPAHGESRWLRVRRADALHLALGTSGFLGISLLGPTLTSILFGNDVSSSWSLSVSYGVAYIASSLGTSLLRNVLIPHGKNFSAFFGTLAGALLGLPLMILLGEHYGAASIAAAFALSEVVVYIFYLLTRLKLRRLEGQGDA